MTITIHFFNAGVPGCIANVSTILQQARLLFDAFALRSRCVLPTL